MLRPRIIPCLLIHNHGLVKTVNFTTPKYVGDPINAVRIFNEKEVDELMVVDIDATVKNLEPDYALIERLAAECRMPLCYGGGIKTRAAAQRIFSLGVEKVAFSSIAVEKPEIVSEVAQVVGNQSVVVVIDVRKGALPHSYEVYTHNGLKTTGLSPDEFALRMERLGAGEIVINSIDQDGMMKGYDLELVEKIRGAVNLPLTVIGGAGTMEDVRQLIRRYGILGAAAGSMFVFKGIYRAVLINYPGPEEKDAVAREVI